MLGTKHHFSSSVFRFIQDLAGTGVVGALRKVPWGLSILGREWPGWGHVLGYIGLYMIYIIYIYILYIFKIHNAYMIMITIRIYYI